MLAFDPDGPAAEPRCFAHPHQALDPIAVR
jgi:hypothetical protein